MPSGLAMAVLAEKNIVPDSRDDIALRDTLKEIKKDLKEKWDCKMPTTPKDDLFSNYDSIFKGNFFKALDSFIEDADTAIEEESQEKASKKWRKHLGSRFPVVEDSKEAKAIGKAEKLGALCISPHGKSKDSGLVAKGKGGVYGKK